MGWHEVEEKYPHFTTGKISGTRSLDVSQAACRCGCYNRLQHRSTSKLQHQRSLVWQLAANCVCSMSYQENSLRGKKVILLSDSADSRRQLCILLTSLQQLKGRDYRRGKWTSGERCLLKEMGQPETSFLCKNRRKSRTILPQHHT